MKTELLMRIKELKECTDIKEVAALLNSKAWIAIDATTDDVPIIVLGRIC